MEKNSIEEDIEIDENESYIEKLSIVEKFVLFQKQDEYSNLLNEREKATFSMMMRLNPEALTKIRKEFFAREDETNIEEFIYIFQKHLNTNPSQEGDGFIMETPEQREFVKCMFELFKDMDFNGDGGCEWQEFTTFTVEKANLLNKRAKLTSIAHYHDTSNTLDPSAHYRHRHEISRFCNIQSMGQFAMLEEDKSSIFLFNSRTGKNYATIKTEIPPIAIETIKEKNRVMLVTSGADMTISTYSLEDPNPKRKHKLISSWTSPSVQMSLSYSSENHSLYSGSTNGNIYAWDVKNRSLRTTFTGHTDIVMNLIVLQNLNNIASASIDKSVAVWDSHTNERLLKLEGHKKGVFDLTYNPNYRLMVSCGFEHDACVWSPFVKSLVYRLRGHHASLIGCHSVENSSEIITADTSGVFKLWDIRNFSCIQTFTGKEMNSSSRLSCFFHSKLPSQNTTQKEDDSRIYAAYKNLYSFDQQRVVHEATTDYTNVSFIAWIEQSCTVITASKNNVIVWDALVGSKKFTHTDIIAADITACCLDDRKRKILIGDVHGKISVFNSSNGQLMKTSSYKNDSAVVSLSYYDIAKRFIAGYSNGVVGIFDENDMEDCLLIRTLEAYHQHSLLLSVLFDVERSTIVTTGESSDVIRLWDYVSGKCFNEIKVCPSKDAVIVSTSYLHPYPLIITSDSIGNITIWGSKGSEWEAKKISGFLNITPVDAQLEPVSKIVDTKKEEPPRRALPRKKNTIIYSNKAKTYESSAKLAVKIIEESKKKWGNHCPAEALSWESSLELLLIGDDLGNLRCYSLKNLLEDIQKDSFLPKKATEEEEIMPVVINNIRILNKCNSMERNEHSALPQAPIDINSPDFHPQNDKYILENDYNPMSYLGVDFLWMIPAHDDRIITCVCTSHGVLTSAADRLVKMWDFNGLPIGVLLQSVRIGSRSSSWSLTVGIDKYIKQEENELDDLINNVSRLASSSDKPNISTMDFSGMQLGDESADFSRSILRQRIDKSSQILGIDFPTHNHESYNMNDDDISIDTTYTHSSAGNVSKSHGDALKDMKSPDGSLKFITTNKKLTDSQQRRKDHKLDIIHTIFKEKSGLKVKTGSISSEYTEEKISMDLHPDDSSLNDDMYSIASSAKYTNRISKLSGRKETLSKNEESMKIAKETGPRTVSMLNTCKRYESFDALENMINGNLIEPLTDELKKDIRTKAELRRQILISAANSVGVRSPSKLSQAGKLSLSNTPSPSPTKEAITETY